MPALNEGRYSGEFLVSEAPGIRSRRKGLLGLNQTITPAMVLGRVPNGGSLTPAAVAGNTGNGACTADGTPFTAGGRNGVYRATCIVTAANGGRFLVTRPDGSVVGLANVGTLFNNEVRFTIADGAVDFALGDAFTLTAAGIVDEFRALNLAGTAGEAVAAGIAFDAQTTTAATGTVVVVDTDCEVNGAELVWPGGITNAQRDNAIRELSLIGIRVR